MRDAAFLTFLSHLTTEWDIKWFVKIVQESISIFVQNVEQKPTKSFFPSRFVKNVLKMNHPNHKCRSLRDFLEENNPVLLAVFTHLKDLQKETKME